MASGITPCNLLIYNIMIKRRSLLTGIAATAFTYSLSSLSKGRTKVKASPNRHVLVLLELRGGNDGLNTLAPIHHPIYKIKRPSLGLDSSAIELDGGLALHPALKPLQGIWNQDRLSFALGVGWPDPNRSHFKAADQWATGSVSGEGIGWIAGAYNNQEGARALGALHSSGCTAIEGGNLLALQLGINRLKDRSKITSSMLNAASETHSPIIRKMIEMESESYAEIDRLMTDLAPAPSGLSLPRGALGKQIELALRLIASNDCPPVLTIAHTGYDTHVNQKARHQRLLNELGLALAGFESGLQKMRDRPSVNLFTVSEFGRRLKENGSKGTDHGSASISMIMGDNLSKKYIGSYPNLDDLDSRGDLKATISVNQLYDHMMALSGISQP